MRKFLLLILLIFNIHSIFSQNKTIDSLKIELKNRPNDFYLQREIINFYINNADISNANKEIDLAKKRFANNKDYKAYFEINDIYFLLLNNDFKNAEIKLNQKKDLYNEDQFPITTLHLIFFNGILQNNYGNNTEAKNYFEKCFHIIENKNLEKKYFINIYNYYANSLLRLGNYKKSLEVLFKILKIKELKKKFPIYNSIGICYYNMKQFDKAEYYYRLTLKNSDEINKPMLASNLALLLIELKKNDEAESLVKNLNFKKFRDVDSSAILNVLSEIEKRRKNYPTCLKYLKINAKIDKKLNKKFDLSNDYLSLGEIYMNMGNYNEAKNYFSQCEKLSLENKDITTQKLLDEKWVELEFLKDKNNNGVLKFKDYLKLSDSLNSEELLKNTNELNAQYETELKESKIKTQQLEIQKQKTNRNIAFSGIGLLLLLSGGGFWFFKNKQKQNELKNQNTLLSLQQNLNAMELQSLNKQLDPHEIKNLLGSISPEIQEKAPEAYRKMLKLFNITKASLNNSSITDSVENQVRQVEDLLSLEKSMLAEPLEYFVENKITNQELQIPRLMLKNLVENSIKHGIKGKENGGKIQVILEEIGNFIEIQVDDTGKGRKHAISLDSGIGTSTYQNLFATLNKRNKESASFEIFDKEQGTKVEVKIPKDYQYN